jgi:hypothetical protein
MFAPRDQGPTAAERLADIRTRQAEAARGGRELPDRTIAIARRRRSCKDDARAAMGADALDGPINHAAMESAGKMTRTCGRDDAGIEERDIGTLAALRCRRSSCYSRAGSIQAGHHRAAHQGNAKARLCLLAGYNYRAPRNAGALGSPGDCRSVSGDDRAAPFVIDRQPNHVFDEALAFSDRCRREQSVGGQRRH